MKYTWWILQIILMLLSGFFLVFGIGLMVDAYSLKDPFTFIMVFFSSSFIILISLTLFITFVIKMVRVYRRINHQNNSSNHQS